MNTKRFFRIQEVCQVTGLSKGGIYKLIRESKFPSPVKLTQRSSGWPDDQVMQWAAAKLSESSQWEQPNGGFKC
jgi:prophage regulatory protein